MSYRKIELNRSQIMAMYRDYLDPWQKPGEVAEKHGVSRTTMEHRFRAFGLPLITAVHTSRGYAEEVYAMYLERGAARTALEYNMSESGVMHILRRHGLPSHKRRREMGLE